MKNRLLKILARRRLDKKYKKWSKELTTWYNIEKDKGELEDKVTALIVYEEFANMIHRRRMKNIWQPCHWVNPYTWIYLFLGITPIGIFWLTHEIDEFLKKLLDFTETRDTLE